jgi:hypothetical protein
VKRWPPRRQLRLLPEAPPPVAVVGAALFRQGHVLVWRGFYVEPESPARLCDDEHITPVMAFECAEEALRLTGSVPL